jgi:hypothetical protein
MFLCVCGVIFLGKVIETIEKCFDVGLCMKLRDLELGLRKIIMDEGIFE